MKTTGIIENSWTENIDGYFAQNNVISQNTDTRNRAKGDDHSIRTDEFGGIDFTYYEARAKSLRSEATFSNFKALVTCLKFK